MEFKKAKLPTFSQWRAADKLYPSVPKVFKIEAGWVSENWRTITFEVPEFRLSEKLTPDQFAEYADEISELHGKLVTGYISVDENYDYVVFLGEVGDGCEDPKKLHYNHSIGRFELENPPLKQKSPGKAQSNKR